MNKWNHLFPDFDQIFALGLDALIAGIKLRQRIKPASKREPKVLKFLLLGYMGARNTGSDLRVEEIVRQIFHIYSKDQIQIDVVTWDPQLSKGYFAGAKQIRLEMSTYPIFLAKTVPNYDVVIACEGSTFKSQFANGLSLFMSAGLAIASALGKPAIAIGAEAGPMDPFLRSFVARNNREALALCRNENSRRLLAGLGVRTAAGTDTAWTFPVADRKRGEMILRAAGWNGKKKVFLICPVNPFWWPVNPSPLKFAEYALLGKHRDAYYSNIHFHEYTAEDQAKYTYYIESIAAGIEEFNADQRYFPVLLGMEKVDRLACQDISRLLKQPAPVIASNDHDMSAMASILHRGDLVASSRYHALVISMTALVPSMGITMDERITNLLNDRQEPHLCLQCDDIRLKHYFCHTLDRLETDRDRTVDRIRKFIPKQLELMAGMGRALADEVARFYPTFAVEPKGRWEEYLPDQKFEPSLQLVSQIK